MDVCACVCDPESMMKTVKRGRDGGLKAKSGQGHSLPQLHSVHQLLQTSLNVGEQLHLASNVLLTSELPLALCSN